ncbi:MAG TPA: hypothetical protein VIL86_19910 [Tepidisphaeraceae bacterium]|jgi:hypothetical protein
MQTILPYRDPTPVAPSRQSRLPLISLLAAIVSGPVGAGLCVLANMGSHEKLGVIIGFSLLVGALLTPIFLALIAIIQADNNPHPKRADHLAVTAIFLALLWMAAIIALFHTPL